MIYAKFVQGEQVVIPAYVVTEIPPVGQLFEYEQRKYRVIGRPLRNDRLEVGCRWYWQPVIPVEEVPMNTSWLAPVL